MFGKGRRCLKREEINDYKNEEIERVFIGQRRNLRGEDFC